MCLNFYFFARLLDTAQHILPMEELCEKMGQVQQNDRLIVGEIDAWNEWIKFISQGAHLYGNYPTVEEVYSLFYFFNLRYTPDRAIHLKQHLQSVFDKLIEEGCICVPNCTLEGYGIARFNEIKDMCQDQDNPYGEVGTQYVARSRIDAAPRPVTTQSTPRSAAELKPVYRSGCGGGRR